MTAGELHGTKGAGQQKWRHTVPHLECPPRRLASASASASAVAFASLFLLAFTASAQTVREQVSVDVVTLTVEAHDGSGRAVRDLRQSDLMLKVDGRAVPIDSFAAESGIVVAGSASSRPAVAPTDVPAASVAPAPARPREIAIFADEVETKSFDRADAYDQLTRFLDAPAPEPRRYLVVRFSGAVLRVECPWTSDPALAKAAIARMRAHPRIERIGSPAEFQGGPGSLFEFQSVRRHLYAALLETIAAFSDGPAMRQILLVSGGTSLESPLDQPKDLTNFPAAVPGGTTGSENNRARFDQTNNAVSRASADAFVLWSVATGSERKGLWTGDITAKAAERDIQIVPIAAEALDRGIFEGVDQKNPPRSHNIGDGWISPGLGVGQAMSAIAEETGAEAILVPRKAAAILASRETERAGFTLTFRDPHTGDKGFHSVSLASSRPGVKLTYRRGYRVAAPEERTLDRVVARFLQPGAGDDPLAVAASAAPAISQSGRSVTRLSLRYTPPRETDPSHERDVSLIAVGQNAQGARTQPIRWTGTAGPAGDAGAYAAALDLGALPGAFTWSLAVRDDPTGLISFVTLEPSK